jgi:hypothetical protein
LPAHVRGYSAASDPEAERRLAAKRVNERLKLVYTSINALAIGIIGAAVIVPGVSSPASLLEPQRVIWFIAVAALHIMANSSSGCCEARTEVTDAEMWRITIEIVILAFIVGGGGYLWARYLARRFDRKYGDQHSPGE